MTQEAQWLLYRGTPTPHDGISDLPEPPPWRRFDGEVVLEPAPWESGAVASQPSIDDRAQAYLPDDNVIEMVNAALYLRRPLLVTGKPGTGEIDVGILRRP